MMRRKEPEHGGGFLKLGWALERQCSLAKRLGQLATDRVAVSSSDYDDRRQ